MELSQLLLTNQGHSVCLVLFSRLRAHISQSVCTHPQHTNIYCVAMCLCTEGQLAQHDHFPHHNLCPSHRLASNSNDNWFVQHAHQSPSTVYTPCLLHIHAHKPHILQQYTLVHCPHHKQTTPRSNSSITSGYLTLSNQRWSCHHYLPTAGTKWLVLSASWGSSHCTQEEVGVWCSLASNAEWASWRNTNWTANYSIITITCLHKTQFHNTITCLLNTVIKLLLVDSIILSIIILS